MSTNLFETAARKKYRFPTNRGDLMVEQLFDLPLVAANGFSLNNVAINVNNDLKSVTTDSFVEAKPVPGKADLENKLEIVKHVIAIKQDEAKAAERKVQKEAERQKILEIISRKEDTALSESSIDDLKKRLAELGAD